MVRCPDTPPNVVWCDLQVAPCTAGPSQRAVPRKQPSDFVVAQHRRALGTQKREWDV